MKIAVALITLLAALGCLSLAHAETTTWDESMLAEFKNPKEFKKYLKRVAKEQAKEAKELAKEQEKAAEAAAKAEGEEAYETYKAQLKAKQEAEKEAEKKAKEIAKATKAYQDAFDDTKEAMQDYNEWKKQAEEIFATHPNARIHVSKLLLPTVYFTNMYAEPGVCTIHEHRAVDRKMMKTFNSILDSRGFEKVTWVASTPHPSSYYAGFGSDDPNTRRRHLRGGEELSAREQVQDERELIGNGCSQCNGGYFCGTYCGQYRRRRRRLDSDDSSSSQSESSNEEQQDEYFDKDDIDEDDEIDPKTGKVIKAIKELDFSELEAVITDVNRALVDQCQRLLDLIALTSNFCDKCNAAIKASTCHAVVDAGQVAEITIKQNGEEHTMEVMP